LRAELVGAGGVVEVPNVTLVRVAAPESYDLKIEKLPHAVRLTLVEKK